MSVRIIKRVSPIQLVGSQGVQSQTLAFVLNNVTKKMDVQVVRYAASMVVDTHAFIQVIIFLGEGKGMWRGSCTEGKVY